MIKIIYDPQGLTSAGEDRVREISAYPRLVKSCLTSLSEGKDQTIILVQPVLLQWFKNMSARYPQGTFVFETLDARLALAQKWGMEIPASVTNEDILQAGLLELDLQPQPGFSFEDTLLAHFYAPIFSAKTFPFTQIAALLNAIEPQRWREHKAVPLLARTLHNRLEEWKSKARSSEQRRLIELFAADPFGLKRSLMQFRLLRGYPDLGEALLDQSFDLFQSLILPLEDLEIQEVEIRETVSQITYLLNNQQPNSPDDLAALLETASGLLAVEFEAVERALHTHPEWITPEVVDQVEEKFTSQSRRLRRRLGALRGMIQPPKPAAPEMDWDVERMLAWAKESYLPYQAWCDAQDRFEAGLYALGDKFSEWLMARWNDLHANSRRMVFNLLPNIAAELKRPGWVNLVLVVDNLGWSFSEMLRELFQERGYYLAAAEPYIAMAPSETEISKKCLLSGAVGYQAMDDKTYKGIIEKGWVPYFNDRAFRYLSDVGALSTVQTIDAAAYVVNYLAVDKALHRSADEIGMPQRLHIQHLLENLVEKCVQFIEKHGLQENIRIHVVSDHGSTRIPAEIPNDLDPSFFKTSGFDARSHRYITVSPERFAGLADNLRLDCFFLPANDFLNPENVLCARRGNRFIPTAKDFYVHGGLLPEEMIVPYLLFEPAAAPLQNLTVLLRKTEYRYRLESIELELGNPNDLAVENISVMVLNGNVESEPARVASLNGKTKTLLQIQARFRQTKVLEDQTSLRLRVRFQARGEQHSFDFQAKITMKKMVEEKSSDLFDV
ncbi:MAG: hypothetical protein AB1522_13585 [Chloroflexota bacterium]